MQNYNVRLFYQLQNSTRKLQNNNLFFAQLRNSNSSELQNSTNPLLMRQLVTDSLSSRETICIGRTTRSAGFQPAVSERDDEEIASLRSQ
jgi:hypothetical protein